MKKNEHGFGVVEILLIVVIVGILGFVGWYVWNSQKKTNTTLDNTSKSQSEPQKVTKKTTTVTATPTTTANTVKIPELGIQFTAPSDIKDITYVIEKQTDPSGKEVTYARLTSKTLTDVSPSCDAKSSSIGVIAKGLGTKPVEAEAPTYYGALMKQFDGFFITYEKSHAACSSATGGSPEFEKASELQQKEMTELQTAVKTVTQTK